MRRCLLGCLTALPTGGLQAYLRSNKKLANVTEHDYIRPLAENRHVVPRIERPNVRWDRLCSTYRITVISRRCPALRWSMEFHLGTSVLGYLYSHDAFSRSSMD